MLVPQHLLQALQVLHPGLNAGLGASHQRGSNDMAEWYCGSRTSCEFAPVAPDFLVVNTLRLAISLHHRLAARQGALDEGAEPQVHVAVVSAQQQSRCCDGLL